MNRITRAATAAVAGVTLASGIAVAEAPAAAANPTPRVVTRAEFHRTHVGMRLRRVERIFGARTVKSVNRVPQAPRRQSRAYRTRGLGFNSPAFGVWMDYQLRNGAWRVTTRSAKWEWSNRTASGPSVTRARFARVRPGMKMAKVHRALGTAGDLYMVWTNGPRGDQIRMYRGPNGGHGVRYTRANGAWKVVDFGAAQRFFTG